MPAEVARQRTAATATAGFIAGDAHRPLFAWHHAPPADARRGAGVVLCPPLGYEYMSVYRTWRMLAGSLAERGFDVLRPDYDGTGNSAGDYTDPDRVDAWLCGISHAVSAVQERSGSDAVALIGCRAGALLALHAASRHPVDRLALWSPFASGAALVRELKAFAALSRQDYADADDSGDDLNVAGHAITRATLSALSALTLDGLGARPAEDVLVVERDDRTADPALAATLEGLGCRVTGVRPSGTEAMLVPPQRAAVAHAVIDAIAGWLADWPTAKPTRRRVAQVRGFEPKLPLPCGGVERVVRFGDCDRLFGVLGVPAQSPPGAPAIVFFNTAVEHHIGPHRLYVPLGREFIASGHPVLRFDIGGIGDSEPPSGADPHLSYPAHMLDDARAALAFMKEAAPDRLILAVGLCSGAWLAFRAAAEHLPVDAIAAINPPLYLREPDRGAGWLAQRAEAVRYGQAMRVPAKWMKALRGRVSLRSFAGVAGAMLSRRLANRLGALSAAPRDGVAGDLVGIARRGVRTLLVFSAHGDGLAYFDAHARPALRHAFVREAIETVVVEGAGHSFRPRAAQQRIADLLRAFVHKMLPRPS